MTDTPDDAGWVVAGVDEAGLGPLLGPLCIGAAAFRARSDASGQSDPGPEAASGRALWQRLSAVVSDDPKQRRERLVVCDSKQLHQPARGIAALEEQVLPWLRCFTGSEVANLDALWQQVVQAPAKARAPYPWEEAELALPQAGLPERIGIRSQRLTRELEAQGIELVAMQALPVLVGEYNRLVNSLGSKADVNCACVCAIVQGLWARFPRLRVAVDRLGARMSYSKALELHLRPTAIEVLDETPTTSAYVLRGESGAVLEISFSVDGDQQHFPVALGSMLAKYTRELHMELLNRWFAQHLPELKPTKGYVTDARRWLDDTHDLRAALDLPDELLIRVR